MQQSVFDQEFELDHDGSGEPLDLQIGFDMIRFVRNDRQWQGVSSQLNEKE